jgi:ABC-type uncharacterized transport system ATPase subunit
MICCYNIVRKKYHFAVQRVSKKEKILLNHNYISGTIGHVAHGKSTLVKAISGVQVCKCYLIFCEIFLIILLSLNVHE